MKISFIHPGTTPTTFYTGSYRHPKTQATCFVRDLTLPSDVSLTSKQNFIPRMLFADMHWTVLRMNELYYWTLLKFISHMSRSMFFSFFFCFCIFHILLVSCNPSAFVICAFKNYLLTYLSSAHCHKNNCRIFVLSVCTWCSQRRPICSCAVVAVDCEQNAERYCPI